MTISEALKSINAYPIPARTINEVCERRGFSPDTEAEVDLLTGAAFLLCKADLLVWLSYAPNVAQGGQSYSFSDEQRERFRKEAAALLEEYGDDELIVTTRYGYKGSRL